MPRQYRACHGCGSTTRHRDWCPDRPVYPTLSKDSSDMWNHRPRPASELIIAVDFDGTVVENHDEYPKLGKDAGAGPWLRKLYDRGVKCILWTVRHGEPLEVAVDHWTKICGTPPWAVNRNPNHDEPCSPKAHAHVFVDDRALGCPTKIGGNGRPVVDWDVVGPALLKIADAAEPGPELAQAPAQEVPRKFKVDDRVHGTGAAGIGVVTKVLLRGAAPYRVDFGVEGTLWLEEAELSVAPPAPVEGRAVDDKFAARVSQMMVDLHAESCRRVVECRHALARAEAEEKRASLTLVSELLKALGTKEP